MKAKYNVAIVLAGFLVCAAFLVSAATMFMQKM